MKRMFFVCLFSLVSFGIVQIAVADEDYDAGWAWADENGIVDPSDCQNQSTDQTGEDMDKSPSFTQGCMDYLRHQGINNNDDENMPDDGDDNSDDENQSDGM